MPSGPTVTTRTKHVSFRLRHEEIAQIKELAEKEGITPYKFRRKIFRQAVAALLQQSATQNV